MSSTSSSSSSTSTVAERGIKHLDDERKAIQAVKFWADDEMAMAEKKDELPYPASAGSHSVEHVQMPLASSGSLVQQEEDGSDSSEATTFVEDSASVIDTCRVQGGQRVVQETPGQRNRIKMSIATLNIEPSQSVARRGASGPRMKRYHISSWFFSKSPTGAEHVPRQRPRGSRRNS